MAKITSLKQENSFYIAEFDDTIFRPSGGGQPSDTGMIKSSSFFGEMFEAIKNNGTIAHKIKPFDGKLNIGDEVELILNEKRRNLLTRMHTGEHLLFKSMEHFIKDLKLDKVALDEDESKILVFSKEITWQDLFKAEELANMMIRENRPIIEHLYTKEEAAKLEGLRIKIDRIKEEKIRIIEIEDFDYSACSGTHCHSTKDIGHVLITRFNSTGTGSYEIRFKVNVIEDLYEMSKITRELREVLMTDDGKITATVKNLKDGQESMKKQMRELAKSAADKIGHELVKDIKFYAKEFADYEKEILIKKASELSKEKSIVAFINRTEKTQQLIITVSKDLSHDASSILKQVTSKFNGKGGGKKDFAMGSFTATTEEVIDEIRKLI
jgi:alanyl-tRNA synthetase